MGSLSSWVLQLPIYVLVIVLAAVIGAIGAGIRQSRKMELQNQRFMCNVPVTVVLEDLTFATRFLDISAKGAKIKLPEFPVASGDVRVIVDGKTLKARLTWQNGHFAGIQFRRALPLSKVHSLAERGYRQKTVTQPSTS